MLQREPTAVFSTPGTISLLDADRTAGHVQKGILPKGLLRCDAAIRATDRQKRICVSLQSTSEKQLRPGSFALQPVASICFNGLLCRI